MDFTSVGPASIPTPNRSQPIRLLLGTRGSPLQETSVWAYWVVEMYSRPKDSTTTPAPFPPGRDQAYGPTPNDSRYSGGLSSRFPGWPSAPVACGEMCRETYQLQQMSHQVVQAGVAHGQVWRPRNPPARPAVSRRSVILGLGQHAHKSFSLLPCGVLLFPRQLREEAQALRGALRQFPADPGWHIGWAGMSVFLGSARSCDSISRLVMSYHSAGFSAMRLPLPMSLPVSKWSRSCAMR